MASPQGYQKLFANAAIQMWDHDPDGTSAAAVTPDGGTTERWVDMRDYEGFAVIAMSSTLTGNGITKLEIVASDSSDGSSNVTVIKDSGTVAADAVGDYVVEECSAAELAQESADGSVSDPPLRYVAGRLTVQNSADEAVVTYIRYGAKHPQLDLTSDTIA